MDDLVTKRDAARLAEAKARHNAEEYEERAATARAAARRFRQEARDLETQFWIDAGFTMRGYPALPSFRLGEIVE